MVYKQRHLKKPLLYLFSRLEAIMRRAIVAQVINEFDQHPTLLC
jgi:hypothetical protein